MMIIDIHSHIGLSEDGAHGKLDVILENMDTLGIQKTMLFATDEKDRGETFEVLNDKIINAQKKHPDKIMAAGRITLSKGPLAISEFQRCCQNGVRALKLKADDGYDEKTAAVIFEQVNRLKNFPVIIHTAHQPKNSPLAWESFFSQFPNINFILAHGGKDLYKQCGEIVRKYKNVYVDTATLSYNRTRHLYEVLGCEKIVFGSDYPYSHPAIELKKFEILVKDIKEQGVIFYKNSARILGLSLSNK